MNKTKTAGIYFSGSWRDIPVISYLWQFILTLSRLK